MSAGTLAAALASACDRFAARPALVDSAGPMTYRELDEAIGGLARAYTALGIGRGDTVVCRLPNGRSHFIAAGAAWALGAAHVAADRELTAVETALLAALCDARAVLHDLPSAQASELARLRPGTRLLTAPELARPRGARPPRGPEPDDVAAIFTTSGSTGTPKLPLGTQGKLQASWSRLAGSLDFGPGDVHLVQLPLSHGFGLMLATAGLLSGGRLVILDRFSPTRVLEAIEREGATVLNGTPAHFRLVLERLRAAPRRVDTLRIGVAAGAAFAIPLLQSIYDELGMELLLMYGSSEGVGVATRDRDAILAGSVGVPEPEGSVAILDGAGQRVPAGAVGEIAFAREFNPVRYWGEPQARATGWYRSGDLGRLDGANRLYVVGRIKLQINRGGLKIDPVEVESELLRCAKVSDAGVVGLPDPMLDERVCACIVAEGAAPALADLRAQLAGRLAPFKLPEQMCVLDALPRTALGKVDYEALRVIASGSRNGESPTTAS